MINIKSKFGKGVLLGIVIYCITLFATTSAMISWKKLFDLRTTEYSMSILNKVAHKQTITTEELQYLKQTLKFPESELNDILNYGRMFFIEDRADTVLFVLSICFVSAQLFIFVVLFASGGVFETKRIAMFWLLFICLPFGPLFLGIGVGLVHLYHNIINQWRELK